MKESEGEIGEEGERGVFKQIKRGSSGRMDLNDTNLAVTISYRSVLIKF